MHIILEVSLFLIQVSCVLYFMWRTDRIYEMRYQSIKEFVADETERYSQYIGIVGQEMARKQTDIQEINKAVHLSIDKLMKHQQDIEDVAIKSLEMRMEKNEMENDSYKKKTKEYHESNNNYLLSKIEKLEQELKLHKNIKRQPRIKKEVITES